MIEGVSDGVLSSLLRAFIIALLLPSRVLGIGLTRGLQVLVSVPVAILRFIGKVSLIVLGGIMLFLICVLLVVLFAGA